MYLALILLVLVAVIASFIIGKAVKTALAFLRGDKKPEREGKKSDERPKEEKQKVKEKEKTEEEQQTASETVSPFSEEQTNRYAQAKIIGITESFWTSPSEEVIDGKAFADGCVESSNLTYLEVNNRSLVGEEFRGFNVMIEDKEKMTLTYQGQAVATLTRTIQTTKKTVDGKEISESKVIYRTNTFPPRLNPEMVPEDLEKMLSARQQIQACEGDPKLVAGQMQSIFSDYDNVCRLKESIDPKIQAKESKTEAKHIKNQPQFRKPPKVFDVLS